MKLQDWEIVTNKQDDGVACNMEGCASRDRLFAFSGDTFGELARSIVEHAKAEHGIEIKATGYWYRSFTPDGKLWAESSQAGDFLPAPLSGMEGEELEHWTAHNEKAKTLTYQRISVYTMDVAEEWTP